MIQSHLTLLESSGLVSLSTVKPDLTYAFRHPLMQEVAYRSLTREDRRNLHLDIGNILEQTYPDRLDELAPILSDHFDKAGDEKKALHYYRIAGHTAQRVYANPEAAMFYRQALKLAIEGKEILLDDEILIDLCGSLGRVLELSGQHVDALRHYQEMEEFARQREDRRLELAALVARITLLSTLTFVFDPDQSRILAQKALNLARDLEDRPAEAKIYWNLLLANAFSHNIQLAKQYGEQSLELARTLNLREQMAYTLHDLGSYVYVSTGEFARAIQILEEARSIWRELDNQAMLADNLSNASSIFFTQGKTQIASDMIDEAFRVSKSINNLWGQAYSRGLSGSLYAFEGLGDQAMASLDDAIRLAGGSGFAGVHVIGYTVKGYLYGNFGALDEGIQFVQEGIRIGEGISNFYLDQAYGCLALMYTIQGKFADAEAILHQNIQTSIDWADYMIENFVTPAECELRLARGEYQGLMDYVSPFADTVRAHGARAYLPDSLYYLGTAFLGLGRVEEARLTLEEAEQEARSLRMHRIRWRILASLAELELQQGNRDAGREWLEQARQEVDFIADHAGNDTLRTSFLSMDRVRQLQDLVAR